MGRVVNDISLDESASASGLESRRVQKFNIEDKKKNQTLPNDLEEIDN